MTTGKVWTGDWHERLAYAVRLRGYESVLAWASSRPGLSFGELADELDGVAAVQLKLAMKDEAEAQGRLAWFARESLLRFFRERISEGWARGENFEYRAVSAFADWSALIGDDYQDDVAAIWEVLKSDPPREGWFPVSADDPILQRAWSVTTLA